MKKWLHPLLFVSILFTGVTGCAQPSMQAGPAPSKSLYEEKREEIRIPFDSKQVSIAVDDIPALHEYLKDYDQEKWQVELGRIFTQTIPSETAGMLADIGYSCGTKLCSHVLVQLKDDQTKTLPLLEGSIFQAAYFSPDESKLAILLGRNEGTDIIRNHVVFVDVSKLEEINIPEPKQSELVKQLVSPDSFHWPIRNLKWLDNQSVSLTVPELEDSSYEALSNWNKTNGLSKLLQLSVDNKSD
ncbi:hypothetical protein [Brevibacillus reuszeri]|uniref:hypothetical protein n=1 Tax=Brevibacillus reuszeri TaxID=54915 RepID=UPI0028A0FB06|nr:hypothetical protein [Brevibacillus reuszeri]